MMEYAALYLIFINAAAFILSWSDKRAAVHHRRRVPEKTLFGAALLGGSVGLFCSMLIFRHKTRHLSFMLGVPAILAAQALIVWFFLYGPDL